ncbi:MAG TPA: NUDIX domain-containing protein [Anaerolineales bacterium]|nr:NUDIX domain-containing protein [Anaerolineales bacterium]
MINVDTEQRWQLPKGALMPGESCEQAAQREVREETGLSTDLLQPIDKIEYWFYSRYRGKPMRIQKVVHFYLLRFLSGETRDHDQEVNEARWVEIDQALDMLTFESEKIILARAKDLIAALPEEAA